MSRIIRGQLDSRAAAILAEIQKRSGWSESRIINEGIKALGTVWRPLRRKKVIGVGKFRSGVPDLGSNPKHLAGFGQ